MSEMGLVTTTLVAFTTTARFVAMARGLRTRGLDRADQAQAGDFYGGGPAPTTVTVEAVADPSRCERRPEASDPDL